MEEYIKFVVYAIAFLVYVVTQIRKVKNKAEVPVPSEQPDPVVIREQRKKAEELKRALDTATQGSTGEGRRDARLLKHKQEEEKLIKGYKSLDEIAEEERQVAQLLQKRQKVKEVLVKDKAASKDEHFDPYTIKEEKANDTVSWLRNKSNLKKVFVAAEILQKKY